MSIRIGTSGRETYSHFGETGSCSRESSDGLCFFTSCAYAQAVFWDQDRTLSPRHSNPFGVG